MIKKHTDCSSALMPVTDALDVLSGKWKLLIMVSIFSGNRRFREIERSIPRMTSKVLAKELKSLEENHLISRQVHDSYPVLIEYKYTDYATTLYDVIQALRIWGINHRKKVIG
jgi:DNA-binding HxlR family transcriptional regulator